MHAPEIYTANNPMQMRDIQKIIEEFKETFKWEIDEKVLDIGCGPGSATVSLLQPILPENADLVGGDVSKRMVDYANQTYGDDRITFKRLDIQGNQIWDEWKPEHFTKIFSFYCLHWVQDQKRAAENIFKLLKPGGSVFLVLLASCPIFELYEKLALHPKWRLYMNDAAEFISPYYKSRRPDLDLTKVLDQADFEAISVTPKSTHFVFPSMRLVLKAVDAVNPFVSRVPEHLRDEYRKEIERMILNLQSTTVMQNGTVEVEYKLLIASALKGKCA